MICKLLLSASIVAGSLFISAHKEDGKVLIYIPFNMLGREMLFGTTITATSDNGNGIVGSKPQDPLLVVFTK